VTPSDDRNDVDQTAVLPAPASPPEASSSRVTPPSRKRGNRTRKLVVEWTLLIIAALGIAFLIKTFLFQAFYIPSGSMEPTLQIGDRVLVNKISYDLHDVNRGDIVVFEAPTNADFGGIKDLVKRVIGRPGETVEIPGDGSVYVNGHRLREPYLPDDVDTCIPSRSCPQQGTSDTTQDVPPVGCDAPASGQDGCLVREGYVLVLGDNRENSNDGRSFGAIEQDTIVGRVFVRIWPIGDIGFL
jgi:signal peptidase I